MEANGPTVHGFTREEAIKLGIRGEDFDLVIQRVGFGWDNINPDADGLRSQRTSERLRRIRDSMG